VDRLKALVQGGKANGILDEIIDNLVILGTKISAYESEIEGL
jgi:hypothetical protein